MQKSSQFQFYTCRVVNRLKVETGHLRLGGRVRKSKNFTDSNIFHAKTFRTKRVNRDTFAFATKVRKTREFHVFLANVHNVELDGV